MLQTDPFFCRPENQKGNAKLGGRQSNMNRFKPGVDSVILIFSDFSGMFVYKFPYFYKYQEKLMPVLLSVLRDHFGLSDPVQHIMRLQFACMNPKSKILKHTDHGGWVKNGHRIHIPVVVPKTNDGSTDAVQFVVDHGEKGFVNVPLNEGHFFEINNGVPHMVTNDALSRRIHLLVDFAEDPIPPTRRFVLEPGQECAYDKLQNCAARLEVGASV